MQTSGGTAEDYAYSGQVMPHLLTPDERLFYYAKDGCITATMITVAYRLAQV